MTLEIPTASLEWMRERHVYHRIPSLVHLLPLEASQYAIAISNYSSQIASLVAWDVLDYGKPENPSAAIAFVEIEKFADKLAKSNLRKDQDSGGYIAIYTETVLRKIGSNILRCRADDNKSQLAVGWAKQDIQSIIKMDSNPAKAAAGFSMFVTSFFQCIRHNSEYSEYSE